MNKRSLFLLGFSLLITLFIPSCSYLTAAGILSNFDGNFVKQAQKEGIDIPGNFSITKACADSKSIHEDPTLRSICNDLEQFKALEFWATIVGLVGLGLLAFVWIAGFVSKNSRTLLVTIFKPGLKLTQLTIAFLVLGHGFLMVASIYYLESYWIQKVHFGLILGVGLVVVVAAFKILASLFTNFKTIETKVLGVSLKRTDAPKLWSLIDEVSSSAKTASPDNLVIGMSPNFFVTEANVRAMDGVFTRTNSLYFYTVLSSIKHFRT